MLAALPLLSVGWRLYHLNKRSIKLQILEAHTKTITFLSRRVDLYFEELKKRLSFVIVSQKIRKSDQLEKEGLLGSLLVANDDFIFISLVDNKGNELSKVYSPEFLLKEKKSLQNIFKDFTFQEALLGSPAISQVYWKEEYPCLNVVYPLGDDFLYILLSLKIYF